MMSIVCPKNCFAVLVNMKSLNHEAYFFAKIPNFEATQKDYQILQNDFLVEKLSKYDEY